MAGESRGTQVAAAARPRQSPSSAYCQWPTLLCAFAQRCHVYLQVRFIVMNNLFQTDLQIQRCYDLKGSTQGRFSGKTPSPGTVLKDLDLDICLKLEEGWHDK